MKSRAAHITETRRLWALLMDACIGAPLADICDWMLYPFSSCDIAKQRARDNE